MRQWVEYTVIVYIRGRKTSEALDHVWTAWANLGIVVFAHQSWLDRVGCFFAGGGTSHLCRHCVYPLCLVYGSSVAKRQGDVNQTCHCWANQHSHPVCAHYLG